MWIIVILSIAVGIFSMMLVPWLIIQIPADYFAYPERREHLWQERHPVIRMGAIVLKSLLGYTFIAAGIGMPFLPGQGLLTIFVGMLLIDFPNKFKVERWLIEKPSIFKAANWIWPKAGKELLKV